MAAWNQVEYLLSESADAHQQRQLWRLVMLDLFRTPYATARTIVCLCLLAWIPAAFTIMIITEWRLMGREPTSMANSVPPSVLKQLTEHEGRIASNAKEAQRLSDLKIDARLIRLEEAMRYNAKLQESNQNMLYAILVAIILLVIKQFLEVLRWAAAPFAVAPKHRPPAK